MAYPQPRCPQCGGKLRLITKEKRWFCDNCQTYVDVLPLEHTSIKGTSEGRRGFSERLILMIILMAAIPVILWFIWYLILLSRLRFP